MSTDTLDSLTDSQLSEAFAVECAGWTPIGEHPIYNYLNIWHGADGNPIYDEQTHSLAQPSFATSADAVLPFLADCDVIITRVHSNNNWRVRVLTGMGEGPSLARAACIALICSKRATPKPAVSELIDGC